MLEPLSSWLKFCLRSVNQSVKKQVVNVTPFSLPFETKEQSHFLSSQKEQWCFGFLNNKHILYQRLCQYFQQKALPLGPIHTGRVSRFARKFARKSFDVACNAVWTLLLETMCSIFCKQHLRAPLRPVWTWPKLAWKVWKQNQRVNSTGKLGT